MKFGGNMINKIFVLSVVLPISLVTAQELDLHKDLSQQYINSTEPATLDDFAGITCVYYDHQSNDWADYKLEVHEKYMKLGGYKGRGPRYPGSDGQKIVKRGLVQLVENKDEFLEQSTLQTDGSDLVWDYVWQASSNYSSQLRFRKDGAYINFMYVIKTETPQTYFGYCWHEKK